MYIVMNIVMLLIGLLLIYLFIHMWYWLNKSQTWPQTIGKVVNSEMEKDVDFYYTRIIRYEFCINNIKYESQKIYPFIGEFKFFASCEVSEEVLPKIGTNLIVYYNPEKPNQCCIERIGYLQAIIPLCFGLILFISAVNNIKNILN